MCLHLVHGYFHYTEAKLSSCHRDHTTHKAENMTIWPFTEKRLQTLYWRVAVKKMAPESGRLGANPAFPSCQLIDLSE